jgi:2-polyprenyl-3-methyl-5-hydroxy-6-metoxy-1,4-benzoquinol methylase/glycosyltransferase involved in cell wall biosynthesis
MTQLVNNTALYICYFNTDEPLVHTQVLPYLRAVARAGVSMHLLTYEKRGAWRKGERTRRRELRQKLAGKGIHWHTLKYHKRPSLIATGYDVVVGAIYSAWLILRHRISIIHSRAHVPGVIGLGLKLALRRKLIFDLRGLMAEEYVDNGVWAQGSLPFRLVKSAERALLKRADHIIVLTDKLKTILTTDHQPQIKASKITVIPCCVDLSSYLAPEPQCKTRGDLTLVYAGSATGLYLTGEMIDFFKVIKSKRKDARFMLLTKADARELARLFESKGVEESAYSIINAAPNEVAGLIKTGAVGISFRKPGFAQVAASPTKIGEYLAAGLPVVSNPGVGDTDDILQNERVGVIVSGFNQNAYERAVDQVIAFLENGEPRERCRAVAAKRYSLSEVGERRYLTVYRSLNGRRLEKGERAENFQEGNRVAGEPINGDACCPACRWASNKFITVANEGIRLRKCTSCGLAFHNEFSSIAELGDYYSHYYHADNLAFSPITEARFNALLGSFEAYRLSGKILDIGCGAGHFLKVAIEKGWAAYGTEIASGTFEQLSRLGVNTFKGEVQSANYPDGFFDVIYCSEVIEHLPDPVSLLRESFRILRPGGLLYLTTPNYDSLSRRLLGGRWRVFGKEHICYFSPRSLSRALGGIGFSKVNITTRNIDPHELKKLFSKSRATAGGGFQAVTTEQLRERLETSRVLKAAKSAANLILSRTSTGDTLLLRAEK